MYQAVHGISKNIISNKCIVHGHAHLKLGIMTICGMLLDGDVKQSLEKIKTVQDLDKWHLMVVNFPFVKY